jgi:hypothetical protein
MPAGALRRNPEAAPVSLRGGSRSYSAAMSDRAGTLARQRDRLADAIREETRATAEALASAHNWRVKWGEPADTGATDITERVAKWLRAYWGA